MEQIGVLLESISRLLPNDVQEELRNNLKTSETVEASPAGAILMGMHVLEYLGFPKYIDDILGIEHTTIESLKDHYNRRTLEEEPMIPSTGIILSLLVADMIACPRTITAAYMFEVRAVKWRTGPLLGIEPSLLNDDRIGRAMSMIGSNAEYLKEVLFDMIITAVKKAGIPLSSFILEFIT